MRRIGENRKLRLKNVMKWTDQVHGPYLPHIRGISEEKNTIVIILIFVSWLIIATDVLLLLLYFMFPISWDYCIPGSLHCFLFFPFINPLFYRSIPPFFSVFLPVSLFCIPALKKWIGAHCLWSYALPITYVLEKRKFMCTTNCCAWWYQPGQA